MSDEIRLEIPTRTDYLALVRVVVAAVAATDPSSRDERIDDLRIAVSEATTNAIRAQRAAGVHDRIRIRCRAVGSRVEVVVEDRGGGFDPEALLPLPPVESPERLQFDSGLGVPLMRRLADEADIRSDESGTSVRLVVDTAR